MTRNLIHCNLKQSRAIPRPSTLYWDWRLWRWWGEWVVKYLKLYLIQWIAIVTIRLGMAGTLHYALFNDWFYTFYLFDYTRRVCVIVKDLHRFVVFRGTLNITFSQTNQPHYLIPALIMADLTTLFLTMTIFRNNCVNCVCK